MIGGVSAWYADRITAHSKLVIVAVFALTVLVAAGAAVGETDERELGDFEVDSPETDAQDFVRENYGTDDTDVVAQWVVRDEGGDVLTRESLLESLRLQQEAKADESIGATLTEQGFLGIENIVGAAAVSADADADGSGGPPPTEAPPLGAQIDALEDRSPAEVEQLLADVLDPERADPGEQDPYEFLPLGYDPGETRADARLTFISQIDESGENGVPEAAYDAQVAVDGLVEDRFDDAFVFGQGVQDEASSRATGDSFSIITPFALVLILFVLGVAYRDPVDILLAFLGIGVVLAWVGGIMGWLGIPMNVILIAVPFLLIGLSIDYALHVVMRYREAREGTLGHQGPDGEEDGETPDIGIPAAMALGFGSVVLALGAATVSTAVGFLSNVVSPLPAIQDFAVLSAGGILATFVGFGVLLPALKVEVDSVIEGRLGRSRRKPAFGVESGRANEALARFGSLTMRAPVAIIVVALVLSTAGVYGATTIDTEFNQADFLPQDAPDWAQQLPGPFAPDTYTIADDFDYLSENFQIRGEGGQSQVLIRGEVTDASVLQAVDSAGESVTEGSAIQLRADGGAAVEGPHTVIRETAAENETVAAAVDRYDTTGDGLPDENVAGVYELLFEADREAAAAVLSRSADGEITSARLVLSVRSSESAQTIADDTRDFAATVEGDGAGVTAVATGQTVATAVIQDALLETLVEAFGVTLAVILLFLTGLFWVRYRSWSHGVIILAPVVISLSWLLGTMALLDIPFNSETAVITSLAIGLGVDYSIHAGERFIEEREHRETLEAALQSTLTGTGGALLASAATTAAGFGVLALALSPPLQRFGIVTASAILFAFLAVVTILPGLLVLRERVV
jgi:predicted RND superfamily exporter protein